LTRNEPDAATIEVEVEEITTIGMKKINIKKRNHFSITAIARHVAGAVVVPEVVLSRRDHHVVAGAGVATITSGTTSKRWIGNSSPRRQCDLPCRMVSQLRSANSNTSHHHNQEEVHRDDDASRIKLMGRHSKQHRRQLRVNNNNHDNTTINDNNNAANRATRRRPKTRKLISSRHQYRR